MTVRIPRRQFLQGVAAAAAAATVARGRPVQGAPATDAEERIPTLCEMCGSRCGIFAVKQGGKVVRIEGNPAHPTNAGRPCARGNAGVAGLYDPDRLQNPLKRNPDGSFSAVSWDQAFKEIGDKLTRLRNTAGPEALVWGEYNSLNANWNRRFMEAYGSPNHTGHAATCFANRNVAYTALYGGLPAVDYGHVRYLLSPGRNLLGGIKAYEVVKLSEARAHGARVVALDPRFSELAGWADEWLPIKPATDAAFLLAVAHVLIAEGLYDDEFVRERTVGLDELQAAVAATTPEWAEEITDIPAATIRRIAKELAAARPAAVVDPGWHGGNGMYYNGFEAARAGAVVNALLGNLGAEGGLKLPPTLALGPMDTPPEGEVAAGDSGGG